MLWRHHGCRTHSVRGHAARIRDSLRSSRLRSLQSKHNRGDRDNGRPVARMLQQRLHAARRIRAVCATGRGRAVGEGAVDQQSARAVDVGDADLVGGQSGGRAVAEQVVHVGAVGVIVAGTLDRLVAAAADIAGLVLAGRLVVVRVRVAVGVVVDGVVPETGPEGEAGDTGTSHRAQSDGTDTRGRVGARAVGLGRATAVVGTTAVGGLRARASRSAAAGVGG